VIRSSPFKRGFQVRKCTGCGGPEVLTGPAEVQRAPAVGQEHAHLGQSSGGEYPGFEESLDEPLKLIVRGKHLGSEGGDLSAPRLRSLLGVIQYATKAPSQSLAGARFPESLGSQGEGGVRLGRHTAGEFGVHPARTYSTGQPFAEARPTRD
jgi:hypothetical protein